MHIAAAVLFILVTALLLRGVLLAVAKLRLLTSTTDFNHGFGRLPSWAQDRAQVTQFRTGVTRMLHEAGLQDADIVSGLNNLPLRRDIYALAAEMEAEGASFIEQQYAAGDMAINEIKPLAKGFPARGSDRHPHIAQAAPIVA